MNKKNILILLLIVFVTILVSGILISLKVENMAYEEDTKELKAKVISVEGNSITIQDSDNIIYTFGMDGDDIHIGDFIKIEYTGDLNKNLDLQDNNIISYTSKEVTENSNGIPMDFLDNGIFKDYYKQAYDKLKELSLDEKINQILLVRYPDSNGDGILSENQFGGYVFFAKDFKDKSADDVKKMINRLQDVSNIPILTATDEEGGKVVRISSNPQLASTPFKSSK